MEAFKTLADALAVASRVVNTWYNTNNNTALALADMAQIAKVQREVAPLDDPDLYYVTFPDGEICLLDMQTKEIRRLYAVRPINMQPMGQAPTVQPAAQPQPSAHAPQTFCTNCGTRLEADDSFCSNCGAKIR